MQLLEHIHVDVDSIAKTEHFLQIALPDLARRGGGHADGYGNWVHIGSESSYIALTEVAGANAMPELRHIGMQVDDIESVMGRLAAAGFEAADISSLDTHPFRRRVYYVDGNGLDWEFIEYLSEDPTQRNDYSH
ncbi:MAG: VOC family protein [Pseudohongiella sp.]|nr:VOC family protein [Pseudohongiella sp.]